MAPLNPQHFRSEGRRQGASDKVVEAALSIIGKIQSTNPEIPAIFTLRHLSHLTDVPYGYLRHAVARNIHSYQHLLLRKKVPGRSRYRLISIPPQHLKKIQDWIVKSILRHSCASEASFAFHPGSMPTLAAEVHCGCDWLLKIDIEDFFHNISEGRVTEVFNRIGYPRLLSFELARLTTCILPGAHELSADNDVRWQPIFKYRHPFEGVLPQGAPTSPMLSNLAVRDLDERLISLARAHGLRYTRYADDLAFSCKGGDRAHIVAFRNLVLRELSREGFRHNRRKSVIRGPGTRRIVLGILVDTPTPRLAKEFKEKIRLHLHYLSSPAYGPAAHANKHRTSVSGMARYVRGLIAWAETVEPAFGSQALQKFNRISWPPLEPNFPEDLEA